MRQQCVQSINMKFPFYCLHWNLFQENILAIGGQNEIIQIFDTRNLIIPLFEKVNRIFK